MRWVNRFIGRSMSCPGTIGGTVPISTSGNRATGWPLYVTSNNKLVMGHLRTICNANSSNERLFNKNEPTWFPVSVLSHSSRLYPSFSETGLPDPPTSCWVIDADSRVAVGSLTEVVKTRGLRRHESQLDNNIPIPNMKRSSAFQPVSHDLKSRLQATTHDLKRSRQVTSHDNNPFCVSVGCTTNLD